MKVTFNGPDWEETKYIIPELWPIYLSLKINDHLVFNGWNWKIKEIHKNLDVYKNELKMNIYVE